MRDIYGDSASFSRLELGANHGSGATRSGRDGTLDCQGYTEAVDPSDRPEVQVQEIQTKK